MATVLPALSATPQLAVPPAARVALDHAWVLSVNAAVTYLNVFAIDDATDVTPTPAISTVTDQIAIAPNFSGLVYFGLGLNRAIAISASTGTDGTGAPSTALHVSLRWA